MRIYIEKIDATKSDWFEAAVSEISKQSGMLPDWVAIDALSQLDGHNLGYYRDADGSSFVATWRQDLSDENEDCAEIDEADADYTHGNFTLPPENGGQIIEESYALDPEAGVIILRRRNLTDGTTWHYAYEIGAEEWAPWSGVPVLGKFIGPC